MNSCEGDRLLLCFQSLVAALETQNSLPIANRLLSMKRSRVFNQLDQSSQCNAHEAYSSWLVFLAAMDVFSGQQDVLMFTSY